MKNFYIVFIGGIILKQTDTLKKVTRSVCRGLIVLFAPGILSPLTLASLYESSNTTQKKKLLKLSKKMLKIIKRISREDSEIQELTSNIKLFYEVYNKRDILTLEELEILRNFCYAFEDKNSHVITRPYEEERENDIYCKYSRIIDELIEEKKLKM